MSSAPIGIFDSGLGGLSVWREIVRTLPRESFLYYADSARCPYGNRPPEEVISFSHQITGYLLERGCKLIVVACNTATGLAIDELRESYEVPFVGMEPALKPATQETQSGVVGVLATENTFRGAHFLRTKERFAQHLEVLTADAKGLVDMIEKGEFLAQETRDLLSSYLNPMIQQGMDQLVLGCSHYPFLMPLIHDILGPKVQAIDPAPAIARQAQRLLDEHQLNSRELELPTYDFVTSASVVDLRLFLEKVAPWEIFSHARFLHYPL